MYTIGANRAPHNRAAMAAVEARMVDRREVDDILRSYERVVHVFDE